MGPAKTATEWQAAVAITRGFGECYNAPLITVIHAREGEHFDAADLPVIAESLEHGASIETVKPMGTSPDNDCPH